MTGADSHNTSIKSDVKAIRILFGALVVGVALFTIISISVNLINGSVDALPKEMQLIFMGIAAALGLGCGIMAKLAYAKGVSSAKSITGTLQNKLNHYRSFLIKCLAICEGAALFSVIVYFLTGDFRVLIITGVMLAVMLSFAPSKKRMITELDIDWNDQDAL